MPQRNEKGQFVSDAEAIAARKAEIDAEPAMSWLPAKADDRLPAVQDNTDLDQVDYDEDYSVLRVLYNKLFRKAVIAGVRMPDLPEIEAEVQAVHGDPDDLLSDLDLARDGKTDVDWEIAQWKLDLAK